jgi:hypothetical protein
MPHQLGGPDAARRWWERNLVQFWRTLIATRSRDMYQPDLHIDTLKLKARNFR